MGFHDFTGCLRGGANHHGDGAEVKMHEGAVLRGQEVEVPVGECAELMEVSDDRKLSR